MKVKHFWLVALLATICGTALLVEQASAAAGC